MKMEAENRQCAIALVEASFSAACSQQASTAEAFEAALERLILEHPGITLGEVLAGANYARASIDPTSGPVFPDSHPRTEIIENEGA